MGIYEESIQYFLDENREKLISKILLTDESLSSKDYLVETEEDFLIIEVEYKFTYLKNNLLLRKKKEENIDTIGMIAYFLREYKKLKVTSSSYDDYQPLIQFFREE